MIKPLPRPSLVSDTARVHVFRVRVYYEDTDAAGIVYYANYLRFAERARTELLRQFAPEYCDPETSEGIAFAVRHCEADFMAPARLDDILELHTRILKVAGATFTAEQMIKREGDDLVRLEVRLACLNTGGRPVRIPQGLRADLAEFCAMAEQS